MDIFNRYVCCLVFAFSVSLPVYSATTLPLNLDVDRLKSMEELLEKGSTSRNIVFETQAVTPSGQQVTRYTKRPVLLSKSNLGKMTKSAIGGPFGIAITASLIAADYFIDGDNISKDVGPTYTSLGTYSFGIATLKQAHDRLLSDIQANNLSHLLPITVSCGVASCEIHHASGRWDIWTAFESGQPIPNNPNFLGSQDIATDEQVAEVIADDQSLSDSIIGESISSGSYIRDWPQILPVSQNINDTLSQDIEGTPAPSYDSDVSNSSTVLAPQAQSQSSTQSDLSIDFPVFCTWASSICDFIDWVKTEDIPPDVPEMAFSPVEPVDWDSGLSNGQCPASPVVEMMGTELTYDLTIVCDGASNIFKPILLLFSLIAAAYIVLGVQRS